MSVQTLDSLGFTYAIGQVLLHKGMAHLLETTDEDTCVRFVVIERLAHECPGGVQLKYLCTAVRGDTGEVGASLFTLLEVELVPLT